MRWLAVALVLVCPFVAEGQGMKPGGRWARSTTVLSAPFSVAGCYASPTQQGTALITVTRATPQTINSGGTTCAANELGVESAGASIWKVATNSVLNSGTHPKTAEATASLGTGAYVGWHAGTGTMTIAAGTATVTGLSCTAVSPGTLCPFTVTVAGTMAVTTSAGTVTQAQIESGTYPTPYIPTAAAAVTRNATGASTPLAPLGNRWCASLTHTPGQNWNQIPAGATPWSTYVGSLPNVAKVELSSTEVQGRIWDSSGVERRVTWAHGLGSVRTPTRITLCNNSGSVSMCANGAPVGTLSLGGTAIQTATLTQVYLGNQNGSAQVDGNLSGVKFCKGATRCGECP